MTVSAGHTACRESLSLPLPARVPQASLGLWPHHCSLCLRVERLLSQGLIKALVGLPATQITQNKALFSESFIESHHTN